MTASLEIFGGQIVAVGNFNPMIFTPDWLELHKLIGSSDADEARKPESNLIVSREVTNLGTDWFSLQVLSDRFVLVSKGALTHSFRDLFVSVLTLLPHTPVSAIGINFSAHYKLGTVDEYHLVGDTLAPKDIWREFFPGENTSIGMASLQIKVEPHKRSELPKAGNYKVITLQPSGLVKIGVFLGSNHHHIVSVEKESKQSSAEVAAKLVQDKWQHEWEDASTLFDGILNTVLKKVDGSA